MRITKAVVTAAKPTQHSLPLQRLVDREGFEKSALELIIGEIVSAGIDQICVVVLEGDEERFRRAAGDLAERLVFVKQAQPRGYGDALYGAKDFVGDETFLHLVGDHLYLSRTEQSCARQLVEVARTENCSVSAVQQTRENRLPYFGAIGGRRLPQSSRLYEVTTVLEKPTPTLAEQELVMAGLRTGYYLCVFGMHVLTPVIMDLLQEQLARASATDKLPLSPALAQLAKRERYLAMELEGTRYDIGVKYGLLIAQLAHCLSGRDRDLILTELVQ
ncbi:MAG: hypothetical protein KDB23_00915, partial [Planctomycetales bacterium]|nr:hypothetical protein [Planctomycetales bacterium]